MAKSNMASLPGDKTEEPLPSFENVLYELGWPGRFQITQIGVIFLCCFVSSVVSLSYIFQGYVPHHVCNQVNESQLLAEYNLQNDSNVEVTYGSCDIVISANRSGRMEDVAKLSCPDGRNFSDVHKTTWISEWDLVCESKGLAELTFSVSNIGEVVGGIIGSTVSDRYGRKPVFLACCVLCTLFELAIVFAPNIYVIIALKFGTGFCQKSISACALIYTLEYVAPKHRLLIGPFRGLSWVLQIVVLAAIAYLLQNVHWQYLQIVICCSGAFTILGFLCLEESPRWLAANGKATEALVILRKASKQNGKDFEKVKRLFVEYINYTFPSSMSNDQESMMPLDKLSVDNGREQDLIPLKHGGLNADSGDQNDAKDSASLDSNICSAGVANSKTGTNNDCGNNNDTTRKDSILTLLTNKRMLIITIITSSIYMAHIMTYYGIMMTSSELAGDRFANFVLMMLVEIPCYTFIMIILRYIGRKVTMSVLLTSTGLCLTASTLCQIYGSGFYWSGGVSTFLFILGKLTMTASNSVIYLMTPELFPTNVRSTASGFCNSVARVGSMAVPYMAMLNDVISWGSSLIFTVMCVLGAVLVMLLPETKGRDLPNTMQELEQTEKSRKRDKSS